MNVGELKKLLNEVNDNLLVVMSSDSEGNSYSPLSGVDDTRFYVAETTWGGYIGFETLTPELEREGYGQEDIIENGVPALVFWPTN